MNTNESLEVINKNSLEIIKRIVNGNTINFNKDIKKTWKKESVQNAVKKLADHISKRKNNKEYMGTTMPWDINNNLKINLKSIIKRKSRCVAKLNNLDPKNFKLNNLNLKSLTRRQYVQIVLMASLCDENVLHRIANENAKRKAEANAARKKAEEEKEKENARIAKEKENARIAKENAARKKAEEEKAKENAAKRKAEENARKKAENEKAKRNAEEKNKKNAAERDKVVEDFLNFTRSIIPNPNEATMKKMKVSLDRSIGQIDNMIKKYDKVMKFSESNKPGKKKKDIHDKALARLNSHKVAFQKRFNGDKKVNKFNRRKLSGYLDNIASRENYLNNAWKKYQQNMERNKRKQMRNNR